MLTVNCPFSCPHSVTQSFKSHLMATRTGLSFTFIVRVGELEILLRFFLFNPDPKPNDFFEESSAASSHLTSCWRTQNILLGRWALKITITSCYTWPATWPSAYSQPSRTHTLAFRTRGWASRCRLWRNVYGFIHASSLIFGLNCRWTWKRGFLMIASAKLAQQVPALCWWNLGFWAAWLATPPLSGWPDELFELCGAWETTKLACWVRAAVEGSVAEQLRHQMDVKQESFSL